jgi:hypothetical protein
VTTPTWVLSPGDLDLWDECRRCFYLGAAARFPRPAVGDRVAAIVGRRLLMGLQGARADKLAGGMPAGLVDVGRHVLRSAPLTVDVPDRTLRCVVRGEVPVVLRLEGGACGVAEVTLGALEPAAVPARARRLHAWAQAVETPETGTGQRVAALGVLAFEPEGDGPGGFSGSWRWTPFARDDAGFFGFLAEALSVLGAPAPPGGAPLCPWCVYRDAGRRTGL